MRWQQRTGPETLLWRSMETAEYRPTWHLKIQQVVAFSQCLQMHSPCLLQLSLIPIRILQIKPFRRLILLAFWCIVRSAPLPITRWSSCNILTRMSMLSQQNGNISKWELKGTQCDFGGRGRMLIHSAIHRRDIGMERPILPVSWAYASETCLKLFSADILSFSFTRSGCKQTGLVQNIYSSIAQIENRQTQIAGDRTYMIFESESSVCVFHLQGGGQS